MNQTEIDELRRLASVSREPRHGIGCIASDCALASAARNALPALLDAAEERDALLRIINDSFLSLNNPTSTLAFDGRNLVPHVEEASRYAEILRLERDALKAKLASKGACDIAAERSRQMEKWGNDHDDEHSGGALAYRAAELAAAHTHLRVFASPPDLWGLLEKHRETRQRLVIAGALVAAEIDRLDRAALAAAKVQP